MTLITRPTPADTGWFTHDRFGMFIHWGLYSLAARHEWVKKYEKMDNATYQKYFSHFDPDLYDPEKWAEYAKEAGMKYFVVTTKHHEGFCLWDSDLTDYKATNAPIGRDLLSPMVNAFRNNGLKVGFYHSLLDWHHPSYTVDRCHPMSENEEYIAKDAERKLSEYTEYLHGQTRELLTRFGKVDLLWYDFSLSPTERFSGKGKNEWQSEKLISMIRKLQPEILMNDRLQIDQDIKTPEQFTPRSWVRVNGEPVVWEACHTFSGSWGYHRDEESWKSPEQLIKMLIDTVSKGGNLLLNVGPTGRGEFDVRVIDRLKAMGAWMRLHSKSIYGCTQAPAEYRCPDDCRYTYDPVKKRLYLHVFSWPFRHIHLEGMAQIAEYAQLLNDASEIKMIRHDLKNYDGFGAWQESGAENLLTLEIPVKKPDVQVPVIEIFLK